MSMLANANVATLTSAQIDGNLAVARDLIGQLEDQSRDFSLPAASGDEAAVALLANVRAQIRQATEDVSVLELARQVAIASELNAAKMKDEAYRARHHQTARERAAEIVKRAVRADELLAELKAAIGGIAETERAIWNALRDAGEPPGDAIVGRKNLSQFAVDRVVAFSNGNDRLNANRPLVAEIARRAWANLLIVEDEADDI
ncbi:hypothetical protein [Tardiphaga sp. 813_E8_N1_3]|uniref:hypothetical protein n=1 Tax=Tardiphaga sp. 813_E8_N1_3 TaxID=3240760 RepID=UPI003F1E637F